MLDKRRINGPPGGTKPPVFASVLPADEGAARPKRSRKAKELRKIFLKTGLTPSASGSAYLELAIPTSPSHSKTLTPSSSSLKLTCTVHGPKPLPRSAAFSPNLVLSTHVKFAPFASRHRRGYLRDTSERDLGVHLETALRGAIIGERWPKSGLDVTITILEGEDDHWWGDAPSSASSGTYGWGMMNVLAGCITVASAAIADARIDCLGLVSGGVSAIVADGDNKGKGKGVDSEMQEAEGTQDRSLILDPNPSEHKDIVSMCVVGYIPSRDEMTELWLKGDIPVVSTDGGQGGHLSHEALIDGAVDAARAAQAVLVEAVRESAERFANRISQPPGPAAGDDDEPPSDGMPSKIQLDVNLWFLYLCLQKSDYKTIDFNAVGNEANLNPPAARMRFTRLRKQIESGSLAGTHGARETSTSPKKTKSAKAGKKASGKDPKEKSDPKEDPIKQEPAAMGYYNNTNEIPEVEDLDPHVKMETDEGFIGDTYGLARLYREGPGADDTDDDIPLAKKRRMASAMLGMENAPRRLSVPSQEHQEGFPQNGSMLCPPAGNNSNLTPWGPVVPVGMERPVGGRPATYDITKFGPPMDPSPKRLGPFPSIMSDNPPFPCDPVIQESHRSNPDIPAIKITDLDADTPTKDCTKQPEKTFGTVEERINHDLFGPQNAHLWLPKKKDPAVTLAPGRTRINVPVIALIEEHERRYGNGKE
ncbi:3'-5'-exoribonuclease [Arachnomyces sp. PD_36]|nr:3'-5'-exoribonuclease [Arachnomyces sp. PD_36]